MTMISVPSDAETVTRPDGSEIIPFVMCDSDGYVIGKAAIPAGTEKYDTGEDTLSEAESFFVLDSTNIGTKVSNSPANRPGQARFDSPQNAWEKMANVKPDDRYRGP